MNQAQTQLSQFCPASSSHNPSYLPAQESAESRTFKLFPETSWNILTKLRLVIFISFKMHWKSTCLIETKHVSMMGLIVTHVIAFTKWCAIPKGDVRPKRYGRNPSPHSLRPLPVGDSQAETDSTSTGRQGHPGRQRSFFFCFSLVMHLVGSL